MKKILVLTANAGAGHIQAAKALQRAFIDKKIDAEFIDCLDYAFNLYRRIYSEGYIWLVKKSPDIWRALYYSADNWQAIEKSYEFRRRINKIFLSKFIKMIREKNPDIVVCTHFLPLEICCQLKKENKINSKIFCAITDFRVHRLWMVGNKFVERYFVATDMTKKDLTNMTPKIKNEKVTVTGIPINFNIKKKIHREKIFTALLLAGAFSVMPIQSVINYLDGIKEKFRLIVAVGKNKELIENLNKMKFHHDIEVLGFIDNMPKLMKSCDLVISKAGGIVSSEAMASELPMIIVDPIPGQEDNNKKYLVKKGAAFSTTKIQKLLDIKNQMIYLINHPSKLKKMKKAAKEIGKPKAAATIVKEILKIRG